MACPRRPLDPGPTSSLGWGMGRNRITRPAPFIRAVRPAARVESEMKSKFKADLFPNILFFIPRYNIAIRPYNNIHYQKPKPLANPAAT